MKFIEHGTHSTIVVDDMIISTVSGALNEESAIAYIDEVDSARFLFKCRPYTWLVDLQSLEGAVPEAWNKAKEHNELLLKDKMLLRKAIVISTNANLSLAKKINSMYLTDRVQIFTD